MSFVARCYAGGPCRLRAYTGLNPTLYEYNSVRALEWPEAEVACWEFSKVPSLGGLEPPSSRLTAERASLLRHRDCKLQSFITISCLVWYSPIHEIMFFIRKYGSLHTWARDSGGTRTQSPLISLSTCLEVQCAIHCSTEPHPTPSQWVGSR